MQSRFLTLTKWVNLKKLNETNLLTAHEMNAPGKNNLKEKVTIMTCINSTGEHKLPLSVIGKSKNPNVSRMFFYQRCISDNLKMPRKLEFVSKNGFEAFVVMVKIRH